MKSFNRIFLAVIAAIAAVFIAANYLLSKENTDSGRPYLVEISRLSLEIEKGSFDESRLADCSYVTAVTAYTDDTFYSSHSDHVIRKINGSLYRFDYIHDTRSDKKRIILTVNILLGIMSAVVIGLLAFIRKKILLPFEQLSDVPYQLSKGKLTIPVKEQKSRFFGKFIWGVDLLRENIEEQKLNELKLHKEKKTLLLSLSHDIKTPLSAIKLYSKALSKGLYTDKEKQLEIAESINSRADEIEKYLSQIITASKEDFLSLEVNNGEFYLSLLMGNIRSYYLEKLTLSKTEFIINKFSDCLLKGDPDRAEEVLQNIIENAVKYGDGKAVEIDFSAEENCILITVKNSGCTLSGTELTHIFDSFYRGSNASDKKGSGLGLYICRQLMHKMNGEIFAVISEGFMCVTAVFEKA
ncbi:MAG: HAMP domain-containing histidine kinase [Oscillospiraceae bacterium]|nr:HAMP domain-containing histidine kinase [Oscillospiraceae bacterium]